MNFRSESPESDREPERSQEAAEVRPKGPSRSRIVAPRAGAVIALALAAGFVAWLVLRGETSSSTTQVGKSGASAASVTRIQDLATSLDHPIFWLGRKAGDTLELTQLQNGKIYIRYLPPGVKVGADTQYLTVATYPFPGAYPAVRKSATAKGAVSVKLSHGGLAVLDEGYPQSVHVAYPDVNYQVEVFDPTPAHAMQMVSAGKLAFLGRLQSPPPTTTSVTPPATNPSAASAADLTSLAHTLGHPIYWAGPKAGYTYELTQTSTGRVFVRYLPPGVKVGDPKANYLTIATYPLANAYGDVKIAAKQSGADTIKLSGGGIAVVDSSYTKSVHLAYPGSGYQVEVFDPSPARARAVVASGQVKAIG